MILMPKPRLNYPSKGYYEDLNRLAEPDYLVFIIFQGEMLKVTRKVDDNWFEGSNMKGETGIFPCSYVELLKTPLCKCSRLSRQTSVKNFQVFNSPRN